MGIKPAAYYFQRIMAQHIFNGLIYEICEVYIDDVLILEKYDEDYHNNMRAVLERRCLKKFTINPDKCIFGASEIELVSHVFDKDCSFSH
jgi:hypothetical protein